MNPEISNLVGRVNTLIHEARRDPEVMARCKLGIPDPELMAGAIHHIIHHADQMVIARQRPGRQGRKRLPVMLEIVAQSTGLRVRTYKRHRTSKYWSYRIGIVSNTGIRDLPDDNIRTACIIITEMIKGAGANIIDH